MAKINSDPKKKMPSPEKWMPLEGDSGYNVTPVEDKRKIMSDRVRRAQEMVNQRTNGRRP